MSFRAFAVTFTVLFFMLNSELGFSMTCRARMMGEVTKPSQIASEIQALSSMLSEEVAPAGNSDHLLSRTQTTFVKNIGQDDSVTFIKDVTSHWRSNAILYPKAQTPQGDLRWFIALVGPEMAHYLGFRVVPTNQAIVELRVPQVKKIIEKVLALNQVLKDLKFDPITFMPESTGFVTEKQIIYGSIKPSADLPDTLLRFAYADHDPKLLPHEVGFHLHMLLASKALVSRARQVNIRFVQLLEALKKDPAYSELAEILISGRSVEMDNGSSLPGVMSAELRINSGMKNYSELLPMLSWPSVNADALRIEQSINFLASPSLAPYEAVINVVSALTGVGRDLITNAQGISQAVSVIGLAKQNDQIEFSLSSKKTKQLYRILKDFAAQSREDLVQFSPRPDLAQSAEVLKGFGQRQNEIEQALRILNLRNP